jgi:hypothetical protein
VGAEARAEGDRVIGGTLRPSGGPRDGGVFSGLRGWQVPQPNRNIQRCDLRHMTRIERF